MCTEIQHFSDGYHPFLLFPLKRPNIKDSDNVNNIINVNNDVDKNIVEFNNNIDDSDDGPTQSQQKDHILEAVNNIIKVNNIVNVNNYVDKNIVEFDNNIDDSDAGPTQSLQKEGISGADVKEQLWDSPFLTLIMIILYIFYDNPL